MEDRERAEQAQVEKRQFFRVEDVLPVVLKKSHRQASEVKARLLTTASARADIRPPDNALEEDIPAGLREVLADIQAKLDMILEKLSLQEEIPHPESRPVSLSATGLRLGTEEDFSVGDFLEIRMLLTLQSPVWIVLYGQVTRMERNPDGTRQIAVRFAEMDGSIRDMITQYVLKRQRELIRSQRGRVGLRNGA